MQEVQLITFYEIHLEKYVLVTTSHNILRDQYHNS